MIVALFLSALLLAQTEATPSPDALQTTSHADCVAARATPQTLTYPDHIALSDSLLQHFHARHPKATKAAFWVVVNLDGEMHMRYADDPAYDTEFRTTIVAYGAHLKVRPVTPGCTAIGSVFVMVFTIPDGRVRLLPVKLNPAKTLPGVI